jgi:phosphoglycerol transferase MdoB-like AlkP superfamily enzyme
MKKTFVILRYILSIHLSGILFFILFRMIFFCVNAAGFDVEFDASLFFTAMQKGLAFDNLIACYLSFLPLIVLGIFAVFNKIPHLAVRICCGFYMAFYTLIILLTVSDIQYFSVFYAHLSASAIEWFKFGKTTVGMLLQETGNYPYIAAIIIIIALYIRVIYFFTKQLLSAQTSDLTRKQQRLLIPLTLLCWGVCFAGMRGTLETQPLRLGYAYFSNNSFYNQLGINPAFFFAKSLQKKAKRYHNVNDLIDRQTALAFVQKALHVTEARDDSPLERDIQPAGEPLNANVVVILMESMSRNYMAYRHNGKPITPYLNSLLEKSYFFDRFYSASTHTNGGITATLYGFPTIFNRRTMEVEVARHDGLPNILHSYGYQTLFFMTGLPQYDNMNLFLFENGFDKIYSQNDYPSDKVVNMYGVQDDYLFDFSLGTLNRLSVGSSKKPFLAVILTISNHMPFIVPKGFENAGGNAEECIVAYSDKCLQDFMQEAEKQEWYKNTLFVILGDHGRVLPNQKYAMPLSFNHIPCFIYSPLLDNAPQRFEQLGGQIDVFPTLMGLLNRPYANTSFGIDLLREPERNCMFFVSDNQLGCISKNYFYMRDLFQNVDILYDLPSGSADNVFDKNREIADSLKTYSTSMLATADDMMNRRIDVRKEPKKGYDAK